MCFADRSDDRVLGAKLVRDDMTAEASAVVLVSHFSLWRPLFHAIERQKRVGSFVSLTRLLTLYHAAAPLPVCLSYVPPLFLDALAAITTAVL